MRGAAEFGLFLALAAGLHLAIAAFGPQADGAESAGQGGGAAVSLQAASAEVSALVARWDTPPEAADQAPPGAMPEPAPELQDPPPAPAAVVEAAPVSVRPGLGLQVPQSDSLPDRTDTAPAVEPSPEQIRMSEIRPQARPPEPLRKPATAKREAQPKKQNSAPVSRSSAAQRASGAGGGTNAGAAQDRGAATLSAGQRQSLFAQWGAQVRRKIESGKRYPSSARGASGTVQIRITVGRDGALRAVSVAGSSGHAALDDAALRAVKSARRFPQAPRQLTDPTYTFTLAMQFST
ncbi:MAG TPA: TonB family protein [Roseovarius sp.]